MKKIVDFMNPVYLNRPQKSKESKKKTINFWCPTGMNPIIFD